MSQDQTYKLKRGYEFGQYLLDAERGILLRHPGIRISLRPKLFNVLLMLIEHPGEVISYEELLNNFWPDEESNQENVTQAVSEIRRILGGSRNTYIETVRSGKGYCFVAAVNPVFQTNVEIVTEVPTDISIPPEGGTVQAPSDAFNRRMRLSAFLIFLAAIALAIYFWISSKSNENPVININPDSSWTVIVLPIEQGAKLETDGRKFEVSAGDTIEVIAVGQADIGRGAVGPEGEEGYRNNTMDSRYKDHVGGLEMWIGPDKTLNRYFIGSYFKEQVKDSGIPTFRIIESLNGYQDGNNSGFFRVNIRKIASD